MTHKWTIALATGVTLMGAATAQDSSQTATNAVEPEIEVSSPLDIADRISVADYEASQTGGVVDPKVAMAAMAKPNAEIAPDISNAALPTEELVPADELDSVLMDSDEVDLADSVASNEIMHGHEVLGDDIETDTETPIPASTDNEQSDLPAETSEQLSQTGDETDQIAESITESEREIPSDAVSKILEEAGVEIADE